MRTLKIIVVSFIVATVVTFATMNQWYAKNIRVTFNSESTNDIAYKIYYTDTSNNNANVDTNFKESLSVKKIVPAGKNLVEIVLPIDKIVHFRLDFGAKPGTVYISDLKLMGNKIINFNDFENFTYTSAVEKHEVLDNNQLRIVSNKNTPYMFYKEKLDVMPRTIINWSKILESALGTFFFTGLFLVLFFTRKENQQEEADKKTKTKK